MSGGKVVLLDRKRRVETRLDVLADMTQGLHVWFPEPPAEHTMRLMRTMGVTVHVDPSARDGKLPRMEAAAALTERDTHPAVGLVSVPAHQLAETVNCKRPNCVGVAVQQRGRYAGLCETHRRDAIEASRGDAQAGGMARQKQIRGGVADAVRQLLEPANRYDTANARLAKARKQAGPHVAALQQATLERDEARVLLQDALDGLKRALSAN